MMLASRRAAPSSGSGRGVAASRPQKRVCSARVAPRSRAREAPPSAADEHSQDVGNIIALEHVNLGVPDLEVARLFFSEGLGLTIDPDTTGPQRGGLGVMWYNVGRQQLHICKGPEAQSLPPGGAIGLTLPNIEELAQRLEGVQGILGEVAVAHLGPGCLEVKDPWGNAFVINEPPKPEPGSTPRPNTQLAISHLLLPCHAGSAEGIAQFYESVLGARVAAGGGRAEVVAGAGSKLVFKEVASLGPRSDEAVAQLHTGWHVALYIADYSAPFRRVEALGLIDNDHPFRDKCKGIDDALRNRQFRLRDVVDVSGGLGVARGARLHCFGHEVRSLHHPRFLLPLHNRRGL